MRKGAPSSTAPLTSTVAGSGVREDTADNAKDLEGSVISSDDKTTPGIEKEEEVEEEP